MLSGGRAVFLPVLKPSVSVALASGRGYVAPETQACLCWFGGGAVRLSKDWAPAVGLGASAVGPTSAFSSDPTCPCCTPGQVLAALEQGACPPSPLRFGWQGAVVW